ncbi:polysaccharide deacetylase [Fibrisoma limi BUZ 3]|uniref:Polysaccharide deacetylase n=1 Tax=Fibrisoma limi BUZ 3 TaxID=1185876 RepID=I2GJ00_9BACT|nr:polysaccharide deacetylase family protein [Fibrisoma limi]CCH53875.1 polysaccharide deacetylase [Fibrisoma limi BUZ 3]
MLRFVVFLVAAASLAQSVSAQKQICITVDDLPTVSRVYQTAGGRDTLTQRLLSHLTHHRVPAIGFVIGNLLLTESRVDSGQIRLLNRWLDAGMELGNHTFAHKDYNNVSAPVYQQDVLGGETLLKPLLQQRGQSLRYFRHPFLHRGNTPGKCDSLSQFLSSRGYQEAPVSVDNGDYLFSAAYDRALLQHNATLAASVGNQYVSYMLDCIHYYEAQADSLFSRPIPHILLMHANTINSVYLGELLTRLAADGYSFIPLEQALQDPAYRSTDKYVGKAGISWLHRWALTQGKKGSFFKGEPEVPEVINTLATGR